MPRRPPIAHIILVMAIKRAHIKHKRPARRSIRGRVAIPAVTVQQTGLQHASVVLQREEKSGHHPCEHARPELVKRRPQQNRAREVQDVREVPREDGAPGRVPGGDVLPDARVRSAYVEPELAGGGGGMGV